MLLTRLIILWFCYSCLGVVNTTVSKFMVSVRDSAVSAPHGVHRSSTKGCLQRPFGPYLLAFYTTSTPHPSLSHAIQPHCYCSVQCNWEVFSYSNYYFTVHLWGFLPFPPLDLCTSPLRYSGPLYLAIQPIPLPPFAVLIGP